MVALRDLHALALRTLEERAGALRRAIRQGLRDARREGTAFQARPMDAPPCPDPAQGVLFVGEEAEDG